MIRISRRAALAGAGVALPRFAIGQSDTRPTITVAVQKIANTNTLDCLREQSNVGTRMATMYTERLIDLNYQCVLEPRPGLATEWRRIDDRTVEFSLRPNVVMHNGDRFTAEDVAASFGPARMFGDTTPKVHGQTLPLQRLVPTGGGSKALPKEIPPVARRLWPAFDHVEIVNERTVRFVNATPDVTIEGRASARGSDIVSRRGFDEASTWLEYARKPIGTGPYKIAEFKPDDSLTLLPHEEYWGGRPPLRQLKLVEVPEVSSRVNGLWPASSSSPATSPPIRSASSRRTQPSRCWARPCPITG